jgi:Tfp pilus assembly protein PilF
MMDQPQPGPAQTNSGPVANAPIGAQHIGTQNNYLGTGTGTPAPPFKNPLERPVGFTGRETEIRETRALLEAHHRVALVGPGGIGKTAIAAEVLFQLAPAPGADSLFPGGIYSHDFYRLAGHEAALLRLLGQAGVDLRGITDVAGEVLRLFARPGVLLYLEGCEKAEDLMALLNITGQSKVLLTSRYQDQTGDAVTYEIHPLPEADGAQLLHFLARKAVLPADPALRQPWLKLSRELGGHALALRLAGAWMGGQKESPEEFAASQRTDKFGNWAQRDQQRQNLHLLFAHSAGVAARKHPNALEVWFVLALHAHAPVPLPVLCASVGQPDAVVRKALAALVNYSLAERGEFPSEQIGQTEPAWQLTHALLGEWGREQWLPQRSAEHRSAGRQTDAPKAEQCSALRCEEIFRAWRAWWRKDLKRCFDYHAVPGGPARYAALQPHWESLLRVLTQTESEEQRELSPEQNYIAEIHRLMGSYSLAQPLHERALATSELTLGQEHPDTLASLNNLAILLWNKGDLAGAEPLYRRALETRERTLGQEHPDTLASLNNLAVLLSNKGDPAGAESLVRRALATRERTLGPEHPNTLTSLNNLANLLYAKGDLAGAEPLYRRALATRERTLGPEHPNTLASLNNLASLLADKGDLAEAEPLFRRALATQVRTLGQEHPNTLASLNNLASLLADKGDLAGAEPLAERAVRGYLAKLGAEHPDTKRAQGVLAEIREQRAKGGKG